MSDAPRLQDHPRYRLFKKVGMVLSALMVLMFGSIVFFVVRTELAHDEATCPFERVGERSVQGEVVVVEYVRRCLPDVQERRWTIQRGDTPPRELGRRRLGAALFDEGRFRWRLSLDKDEQVVLHIENDGASPTEFREAELLDQP